jgi:hypothetical protein
MSFASLYSWLVDCRARYDKYAKYEHKVTNFPLDDLKKLLPSPMKDHERDIPQIRSYSSASVTKDSRDGNMIQLISVFHYILILCFPPSPIYSSVL